jgi:hypothetical protein
MRAPATIMILLTCFPVLAQPGDYFQQQVNYRLRVALDDSSHELSAHADISYINNSPDTLTFIWFHLWPNAYSSNKTALAKQIFRTQGKQKLFEVPIQRGFIDSLSFTTNGETAEWELMPGAPDICRVILASPLFPGDSVRIETPFHVKIPVGNISRMGLNSGVYQVSQWYPKPAVYDISGWHPMPYLDQGEYYSEFGSFDVTISIGENYVVAASGELRTESEIAWLSEVAGKWQVYDAEKIPVMKTIRFTGEDIHDFAWVASKRFRVMQDSIILPGSGRKVKTMVFFTGIQGYLWEKSLEYVKRSLMSFSEWIGDYPYNTFTAVQAPMAAGSGMEYPGLAVIGYANDDWSLNQVITHEVAHNWFYSSIGSNERRYPFMDESLANAYEVRHMDLFYPGKKMWESIFRKEKAASFFGLEDFPEGRLSEIGWLIPARNNLEQPLNLPAWEYSPANYVDILYFKGGQGFNYLRSYLGDAVFDTIMHQYFTTWKSRHPSPGDLRAIFESVTDRNLDWFFDDYLQTTKRFDYSIESIDDNRLKVRNRGEMISPFPVTGFNGDSVKFKMWVDGFAGSKTILLPGEHISHVRINSDHLIPEINHTNNNTRTTGLFKKADPMVPRLLMPIEMPEWRTLIMVPIVNWNSADGFMAGVALNNGFSLPKRIEYIAIPFYSFRKMSLAGKGRVAFNITPYNNPVRKATIYAEGSKFGASQTQDFRVLRTGFGVSFRNNDFISETSHGIFGRHIWASDLSMLLTDQDAEMLSFGQWGYSFERPSIVNPFSFTFMHETNGEYNKVSATLNYKYSYNGKNNGLEMQFFAGVMPGSAPERDYYAFAPSGRSGGELYLYQGEFPDRFSVFTENFWSRQMLPEEGRLVTPVNDTLGYSRWLLSASLASTFPGRAGRLPVKPFMNFVYNGGNYGFMWEAGFKAGIWGFFEVHIPLIVSDNISFGNTVRDRLRFIISLESLYKVSLRR